MTNASTTPGPLASALVAHRDEVIALVEAAGGSNVRVFGSVATGDERVDSDIDLLFTMGPVMSLLKLERLQRHISLVLEAPVDLLPDSAVAPYARDRIFGEAVAV